MKRKSNDSQPMFDFDAPVKQCPTQSKTVKDTEINTRWRCMACGNELYLLMSMKQYMDEYLPVCAKCGGQLRFGY